MKNVYTGSRGGFVQLAIIPAALSAIGVWFAKKAATFAAKYSFLTVQGILASALLTLQITIVLSIVALILNVYNIIQGFLDFVFGLDTSSSVYISTAVKVTQAVGVWDGMLDAINLIMPIITSLLVIKISSVGIRILRTLNKSADRLIKTSMSSGL